MIFLNMHELYSSGMCLVPLPNGTFIRRKLEQVICQGVGMYWLLLVAQQNTEPAEAGIWDDNEPGHLSENDETTLVPSQLLCNW